MKVKRYKHARRILSFYKNNFGLREPYQILVDGTFCQAALTGKIQLKEQLPKYLGGSVQLVTTRCVQEELHSLGREVLGAFYIAKRLQLRSCGHSKKSKPATECILSLLGEGNPHHYFIATQDPELKSKLREVPGNPLLHIVQNTIVLEGPSDSSQQKADELSTAKLNLSSHDKLVIESLVQRQPAVSRKRRRRAKGPNPLSVKKSYKFTGKNKEVPVAGVVSKSKKRRARLQRRKAVEVLAQVMKTLPASDVS